MSAYYAAGTPERVAWQNGKAVCPECQRYSCRGQCGCRCDGCKKTPLEDWEPTSCDVIRAARQRSTHEGREEAKREYRASLQAAALSRVDWGECVAQVERAGCPHETARHARKPEPRVSLAGAKHWWGVLRGGKPGLLLSGTTGCGKSVAAGHIAAKFAESRRWWVNQPSGVLRSPLVWLQADDIGRHSLIPDDMHELLERAGAAEFLVIDELGASGGKAGMLALSQLMARRIDSGKALIITTNADGAQLAEPLGRHVVDRMQAMHHVKSQEKSTRGRQ